MINPAPPRQPEGNLRRRAERAIQRTKQEIADMASVDVRQLVYDLQVHQIELELQNEELRQSQLDLTAAHKRYSQLYNLAPVGYLTLDARGRIQQANQMAHTLLEVQPPNLVGHYLHSLLSVEDADQLTVHLQQLRAGDVHQTCDVHLDLPSKVFRVIRLDTRANQEPADEPDLCRMTLVDITEGVQAEAERKRLEGVQRQSQKLEALGTLASGIAHEFNNVLCIISLYLQLAHDDIIPGSPTQLHLQEIVATADRAKNIVQQILAFSRQGEIKREPVSLAAVVKSTVDLIRGTLPATIELRSDIVEEQSMVWADVTQMHQILINLCTNAEYAMRDTLGLLDISVTSVAVGTSASDAPPMPPGTHVCLSVRNSGAAIPEDVQARLFDPFFTTKAIGEGTGMGLAIVHGIVTDHGGVITVDSTPESGTTFSIYLPRHTASPPEPMERPETQAKGGETILLVDDEPLIVRGLEATLKRDGYHVVAYTDPRQALRDFDSSPHRFDVVISDQTMPGMTGEDLARSLRRVRPDVPIILCTGFSHVMNADRAHQQGIDAFCIKPINAPELAKKIHQVLARHGK